MQMCVYKLNAKIKQVAEIVQKVYQYENCKWIKAQYINDVFRRYTLICTLCIIIGTVVADPECTKGQLLNMR